MFNNDYINEELNNLSENFALRKIRLIPQNIINFATNDYLGIGSDKQLYHNFFKETDIEALNLGSTSSRLLSGNSKEYDDFECLLSNLYGNDVLLFNSGYHANIGILPALCNKNDIIIADKLVHASIIDGIKLSGCEFIRYKHNDMNHLENILKKYRNSNRNLIIVSESVFSMDGDYADLNTLVMLKQKYGALLYIDEAHAIGVLGNNGLGLAEHKGCIKDIDLIIGTFGKAIASQGAFAVCSSNIKNYLINKMRSLIFTTSLPSINIAWTKYIFEKIPQMSDRRKKLSQLIEFMHTKFKFESKSYIMPVIIGNNTRVVEIAEYLYENGIYCPAIRYPTVPSGTERLRVSLSVSHNIVDIEKLVNLINTQIVR